VRQRRAKRTGNTKAIILTVLVHAAVILVLVASFNWPSGAPRPAASNKPIVNAVAVDAKKVDAELNHIKEMEAKKRQQELAQKQELQRMLEKAAEADQQRKQAEAKRKAEEAKLARIKKQQAEARKKAVAEKKRRAAEAAARKKRQEAARKKAAAAKKARQAKAAREAAERKRQAAERQRQMQAEMERERKQRRAASELSRYAPIIQQRVTRYWIRPPDVNGLKCSLLVRLTPGGEVTHVEVLRSSGNDIFDRSVVAAVYKATPLPLPQDPELAEYFREIRFDFDPSKG
jgi:colicin import membrane protein